VSRAVRRVLKNAGKVPEPAKQRLPPVKQQMPHALINAAIINTDNHIKKLPRNNMGVSYF